MGDSYSSMSGVLINRGNMDTNTHTDRILCENEDRDQDDTSMCQGTPRLPATASS